MFALAWPTYGTPLFLFTAFVPLLLLEFRLRHSHSAHLKKKVFALAYLAFFIFNASATWWLYFATPFGMCFAILVNSLLMSLVFTAYHVFAKKMPSKLSKIALVSLWISFEKFHLNWEFSWPWLHLGNGFSNTYKWVQWYEYTGVFGGTFWVLIVNLLFFNALIHFLTNKNQRQFLKKLIAPLAIVLVGIAFSLYRYHTVDLSTDKTSVIVLQPNIDPYTEKYQFSNSVMANKLLEMARVEMDSSVAFVIAPETTLPKPRALQNFKNSPEYGILDTFSKVYPNVALVAGITFYEAYPSSIAPNKTANFYQNSAGWYNSYNSSFCLQSGKPLQTYHKSKLVVGVEHIPYRFLLDPLLKNSMIDLGGSVATLSPQEERTVFSNSQTRLAPIICYESVYGEHVSQYILKGAQFLAILTNDGWWNDSQGHKQHLSLARLRAIETRRSVARSANTGISALINQRGDVLESLPYGEKGILKGQVALSSKKTYYTQHGDAIFRIGFFVLILIVLGMFVGKRQKAISE